MKKTFDVIYDGEVLRPQEPLDLAPHTIVRVTIKAQSAGAADQSRVLALAGQAADEPIDDMLTFLNQARTTSSPLPG